MRTGSTRMEELIREMIDQRVSPQFKMVNEDRAFKAADRWKGASSGVLVINNPTTSVEMYVIGLEVWALANADIEYYLDPTFSGGTSISAVPYRLGSGATSQMQVLMDPTVTANGTLLFREAIPGGKRRYAQGGVNEGFVGFSLLPGHALLVSFTVTGAASSDFGFKLSWWEIETQGWSY